MKAVRPAFRFKLYPTGEFSATRVKETLEIVPSAYGEGRLKAVDAIARVYERHHHEMLPGTLPTAAFVASQISPLGLSNVPNSHKPRKARGRRGMTRYNKRLIVNSVLLMERQYGKRHLSFLTLTLPPQCASREADLYAESKRQMGQWLQRSLARLSLPSLLIGCTEVQTARLTAKGEFALHEHWVFVGRKAGKTWGLSSNDIARAWANILVNVYKLGDAKVDFRAAVRVESIKKSAASYLGKYVSKGEKCVQALIENGHIEKLPSSWVTRSTSILKLFQSSISILNGEDAILWLDYLTGVGSHLCRWKRHLYIDGKDGTPLWLGFIGYLSRQGLKEYRSYG